MSIWSTLLSLVIPVECVRCQSTGEIICASCRNHLLHSDLLKPIDFNITPLGMRISSHLPFSEAISRIVLGAKDDGNRKLEEIVINSLLRARSLFPSKLILVPIPSTSHARMKRGRDFVFEISRAIAQESGDLVLPLLSATRKIKAQKRLNAEERLENMNGAFTPCQNLFDAYRYSLATRELLIVDDVLTTGATMREAFRALSAGQARCIGGISAVYSLNWRRSHLAH